MIQCETSDKRTIFTRRNRDITRTISSKVTQYSITTPEPSSGVFLYAYVLNYLKNKDLVVY